MLEVIDYDGSADEWNAGVAALDGSTFCHLHAWGDLIRDVLGHDGYRWVAVDGRGNASGYLPAVHVKSRLFGDYLLSMPFLSYGGPLGSSEARIALGERAKREADALGVDLLELRGLAPLEDGFATSDRKITVVKQLPDTTEALWDDGLKAKVRSQVRKPMKEGMTASVGNDAVDAFYAVFSRTMRDLGTPVLPKRFFREIADRMGDHVLFSVVEHEGEPAAAGCGFLWKGEFEITWAGASRELSRLAPNMLLYWSLMEATVERGGKVFNFGRCTPGSGTHRFKRQWGTEDVPLPWAQWSPGGVDATPSPDSPLFQAATRTWSRLPLWLANRIGPMISRSLP